MKLVDILARELKEWPEGAAIAVQDDDGEVKFSGEPRAWLDVPGRVWIREGEGECFKAQSGVSEDFRTALVTRAQWQAAVEALRNPLPPLKNPLPMPNVVPPKQEAIDWSEAPEGATHYSTHSEAGSPWLKFENASVIHFYNGQYWSKYPEGSPAAEAHFRDSIARPDYSGWTGNGLPPIGTICEQHPKMGVDEKLWRQVKVIAHVTDFRGLPPVAVFMPLEGTPAVGQGIAESFRVFKSEEEVAAEEREKAIAEMIAICRMEATDSAMVAALYDAGYRKQVQP